MLGDCGILQSGEHKITRFETMCSEDIWTQKGESQ